MSLKRFFALICAFVMLGCIPAVHAEDDAFAAFITLPDRVEYQGGVVLRGYVKGADTSLPDLEIAYALTSMPYIVIGQPTTWEVVISGGSGDYSCSVTLFHQELDSTENWYTGVTSFALTGDTFSYTFTEEGRYFWQFQVMDSNGAFLTFQTRPYESHVAADETNTSTVAGKANWVVDQVITASMSTYDRALALHDWLIYNARYDGTFTYYDASGVLLHGTGVCDSYARAYLMLCTIAGIECIYVSGQAGGGAHGWNMIKLDDGNWYHVDCTWDDPDLEGESEPVESGYEHHDYFCIDDETMAKDHTWNTPDEIIDDGFLPPSADGGDYSDTDDGVATELTYHFTFSTIEEYDQKFDDFVAAGNHLYRTTGKYTGDGDPNSLTSDFETWLHAKAQELANQGLVTAYGASLYDAYFTTILTWNDPSSYILIPDTSLRVSVGENALIIPSEYYPHANAFTWTSSDTSVATVTAAYDAANGLVATVTGVSAGTATITATPANGEADTVTVIVLPAYAPDFDLTLTTTSGGVNLDWNTVPGITEYQIIRVADGAETVLTTVTGSECTLTGTQLPGDVLQQVYVLAVRKVAGEVIASYKSDPVTYGSFTPSYTSSLPDAVTVIDADAFAACTHLTSFDIPSRVTTIGARAFAGCTSLTTIRIPASVTSIGSGAFTNCPLKYAEVVEDSYADAWLQQNCPGVILLY